jgi:hypothetical protein
MFDNLKYGVLLSLSMLVYFVVFDTFDEYMSFFVILTILVLDSLIKVFILAKLFKVLNYFKVNIYKMSCYCVMFKLSFFVLGYYNNHNFVKIMPYQDLTYNHFMMGLQCIILFFLLRYSFKWVNKKFPHKLFEVIEK